MHIPERMPILVTFLPNVTRVRGRTGKGRSVTIVVVVVIIIIETPPLASPTRQLS